MNGLLPMANTNYVLHLSAAGKNPVVSGDKRLTLLNFINLIRAILSGQRLSSGAPGVQVEHTAVAASGTVTLVSCVAGTVIEVNGVPFTAKSGAPTTGNNEFNIDTSDAAGATSLAAAINASTTAGISGVLTATSTGLTGVVTVTNSRKGPGGNAVTLKTLGVVATGIVTYVAPAGTQTVVVNGVTAYNAAAGASATLTAASAAAFINASGPLAPHVRALSRAGVLHVFALKPGTVGNAITLSCTGTGATATVTNGRLAGGTNTSSEGVAATGTLTLTSWLNGETVVVNGVTITAHTNTQANNQVDISGSDTADAANLALAINNSTTAALQDVIATPSGNVVTVTARRGGTSGNTITLASGQASVVANVARLATGAVPTTAALSAERLASGSSTSATFTF